MDISVLFKLYMRARLFTEKLKQDITVRVVFFKNLENKHLMEMVKM